MRAVVAIWAVATNAPPEAVAAVEAYLDAVGQDALSHHASALTALRTWRAQLAEAGQPKARVQAQVAAVKSFLSWGRLSEPPPPPPTDEAVERPDDLDLARLWLAARSPKGDNQATLGLLLHGLSVEELGGLSNKDLYFGTGRKLLLHVGGENPGLLPVGPHTSHRAWHAWRRRGMPGLWLGVGRQAAAERVAGYLHHIHGLAEVPLCLPAPYRAAFARRLGAAGLEEALAAALAGLAPRPPLRAPVPEAIWGRLAAAEPAADADHRAGQWAAHHLPRRVRPRYSRFQDHET